MTTTAVRPPRVPDALFSGAGYFLPRLMFLNTVYAPHVHWGDIALALDGFRAETDLSSAAFWDEWRLRWEARGRWYEEAADRSGTVAGRARARRSAAACLHWAEFMYFDDVAVKWRMRNRVRELTRLALAESGLDIVRGQLPPAAPGEPEVPYQLVLPPTGVRPGGPLPCAVFSNGLDSVTEVEVLSLAEAYLERGIAALLFDGPGQGVHVGQTPLKGDMEQVVARLVALLRSDPRIDADRLAFAGVSFGGYFALRVARDLGDAFRCVVNFSGGPRVSPFAGLPRRLKDDFRFALRCGDDAALQARLDELALEPAELVRTEVLSIHGALDDIFPLTALRDLDRAWGARHRLVVHEREAHVCLNSLDSCNQEAADWVARRLSTGSAPSTEPTQLVEPTLRKP
ncbi:prolyl oligopeptidase family serine peptidase [Streptomyces sp. NPDC005395]|uniref:alpha/beta hydrolase family protein n=1 Tax=Streptomyces sp. NPDC005395 TaxID=3157042 RepID=UPI0033BFB20A